MMKINDGRVGTLLCPRGYQTAWADDKPVCPPYAIIVDDPDFKDGTDVFILTREPEEEVHHSADELAELEAGIAEANRGEMIPSDEFFAHWRRYG